MTTRKPVPTDRPEALDTASHLIEEKLVAFAEQLGSLIGAVQTKAEGWLDRTALTKEIERIQAGAADLLAEVKRKATESRKTAATPAAPRAARPGRGPVDAPGKRHRKPPPQERLDKHLGEPRGKQMGQKNFKAGRRSGRS